MTEFCKCGHHITQHNISPETQINLFKMRPCGIFSGMDPNKFFKHETCIGYGKFLFEEEYDERLDPSPSKTKWYDPCPCKGFEAMKPAELEN